MGEEESSTAWEAEASETGRKDGGRQHCFAFQ